MLRKNKLKGQSLVEFALVVPVLLLILIGVMEFALLLNSYLIVQATARDVVRQISVGGSDATVIAATLANVSGIDPAKLTITLSPVQASRSRGNAVTASLTYNHEIITPFLSLILGQTQTWVIEATMRVE